MKIKLNEKYILNSDSMNIWISEIRSVKNPKTSGEDYESSITGYHGTLENCLKSFVDRKIRSSDAENIEQFVKEFNQIKSDIKEFCKSINNIELLKRN